MSSGNLSHVPVHSITRRRGLGIVISSTVSVMMALTWAGVRYPWVSAHVLVPLCLGAIGLVLFFVMELCTNFIKEPTVCNTAGRDESC